MTVVYNGAAKQIRTADLFLTKGTLIRYNTGKNKVLSCFCRIIFHLMYYKNPLRDKPSKHTYSPATWLPSSSLILISS